MKSVKTENINKWVMILCTVLWLLSGFEVYNLLDQLGFAKKLAENHGGVIGLDGKVIATPDQIVQHVNDLEKMIFISRSLTYYIFPVLFIVLYLSLIIMKKRKLEKLVQSAA